MLRSTELIWARYDKKDSSKFYLLFYLGERDNLVSAIIADRVPENEIAIIRANLAQLRIWDQQTIQEWVKQTLPTSYTNAYRMFEKDKLEILQTYGLKGFENKIAK